MVFDRKSEKTRNSALALTCAVAILIILSHSYFAIIEDFSQENGARDAMEDVNSDKTTTLYYVRKNQVDSNFSIIGLNCPDLGNFFDNEAIKFERLAQGDWAEGGEESIIDIDAESTRAYAYIYNQTIFNFRHEQLQIACPGISSSRYIPMR